MGKVKNKKVINHKAMEEKMCEYINLSSGIKNLEEQKEKVKKEIISVMDDFGLDELAEGNIKVTHKEIVSNRLDQDALKKAMPELCEKFTKPVVTKPFKIGINA